MNILARPTPRKYVRIVITTIKQIGAPARPALVALLLIALLTSCRSGEPQAEQRSILAALYPATRPVDDPPPIMREFRAAWVATVGNIDWPSKPGLSTADQQKEA